MAKVPVYELVWNKWPNRWSLVHPASGTVVKVFASKRAATRRGSLELSISKGIVKILRKDGGVQEVRSYPRSLDPRIKAASLK